MGEETGLNGPCRVIVSCIDLTVLKTINTYLQEGSPQGCFVQMFQRVFENIECSTKSTKGYKEIAGGFPVSWSGFLRTFSQQV